jgi:hypothetical protein
MKFYSTYLLPTSVVDSHHFDEDADMDPDPTFHYDVDLDPNKGSNP